MSNAVFSSRKLAVVATLVAAVAVLAPAPSPAPVSVYVGGQPLYLNPGPIERNGRVFVPLRGIFERLGAAVVYSAGTINATKGRTTVSLQIGSTQATVDGQPQYLDVAPFIVGATTYVPLRFVAQSLGANVGYDASTRAVSIQVPHGVPIPVRPIPPPNPPPPPPVSVVRLIAQQPAPGTNVANRFVTISATFSNQVAPGRVRIWLDGADITSRSGVSRGGFSYAPPAPLGFGSHTVRASGFDAVGSPFDRSWSFNVSGPPPAPVSPIQLRAQQPAPGANVANRFALISAQFSAQVAGNSVRVWLDGADRTSQSGVSGTGFSYKPPAPLDFGSHTVRVTGHGLGGVPFDRSWSFVVTRPTPTAPPAKPTLTITQPAGNAPVGQSFVIRGTTAANARIHVTVGASPAFTGQFNGNAVAGPLGNFNITVTMNDALMGQRSVRVKITATDPASGQSVDQFLQLRLK
jgi:hypothetical protein